MNVEIDIEKKYAIGQQFVIRDVILYLNSAQNQLALYLCIRFIEVSLFCHLHLLLRQQCTSYLIMLQPCLC